MSFSELTCEISTLALSLGAVYRELSQMPGLDADGNPTTSAAYLRQQFLLTKQRLYEERLHGVIAVRDAMVSRTNGASLEVLRPIL
jgi:hypothetical protein